MRFNEPRWCLLHYTLSFLDLWNTYNAGLQLLVPCAVDTGCVWTSNNVGPSVWFSWFATSVHVNWMPQCSFMLYDTQEGPWSASVHQSRQKFVQQEKVVGQAEQGKLNFFQMVDICFFHYILRGQARLLSVMNQARHWGTMLWGHLQKVPSIIN